VSEDPAYYDRALRRMRRFAVAFAVLAVTAVLIRWGWADGIGCGIGAAASLLNLGWWQRLAGGIGPAGGKRRTVSAVFLGMRYLILGGICFVIIKFFGVSLPAIVAGLLISVAAVLAEIVYELVFTR
jgi:hypothetical protein